MPNILIFGNSGSGKSTLAKELCSSGALAHLDLDTLAWKPSAPPERMPLDASKALINKFVNTHQSWVIEGCYTDLLEMVLDKSTEIIFLDLPIEICVANAKSRPWEPHKYESKEAQDANLEMLISWISQYPERNDTFSQGAHNSLYKNYPNKKRRILSNRENHK